MARPSSLGSPTKATGSGTRRSSRLAHASRSATSTTLPAAEPALALLRALLHVVRRRQSAVVRRDLREVIPRVEVHDDLVGAVAADVDLVAGVGPGPLELHGAAGVPHRHDAPDAGD